MSYDGRLMRQALARFDEDKQRRAENFRARERAVYTKCPRIEEIDRELSHTMAKIIASGLRRGTDPRPAIEALREENLNLQQEKRLLLTRLGLPGDYLEEKPKCSRCNDTGFLGSEVCSCLRGYYAKEQNKELSGLLDLGSQCFENFNFDYYSSVPDEDLGVSPRTNMERVYDICQDYAHEFSPKSGNLLLTGGTGLGLSIVKHGAQVHHAQIAMQSALGEGTTITLTFQMDDEPGILSDVLKIIAEYRANILTIHQSIPINGIASLTLSIQVLQTTGDISRMIEQLEGQTSVHHVKILAKE